MRAALQQAVVDATLRDEELQIMSECGFRSFANALVDLPQIFQVEFGGDDELRGANAGEPAQVLKCDTHANCPEKVWDV